MVVLLQNNILQIFIHGRSDTFCDVADVNLNADAIVALGQVLPLGQGLIVAVPAENPMQVGHKPDVELADLVQVGAQFAVDFVDLFLDKFYQQFLVLDVLVLGDDEILQGILVQVLLELVDHALLQDMQHLGQLGCHSSADELLQFLQTFQFADNRPTAHGLNIERFQLCECHLLDFRDLAHGFENKLEIFSPDVEFGNPFGLVRGLLQLLYLSPELHGMFPGLVQVPPAVHLRNGLIDPALIPIEAPFHQLSHLPQILLQIPTPPKHSLKLGVGTQYAKLPLRRHITQHVHLIKQFLIDVEGAKLAGVVAGGECSLTVAYAEDVVQLLLGYLLEVVVLEYFLVYALDDGLEVVHRQLQGCSQAIIISYQAADSRAIGYLLNISQRMSQAPDTRTIKMRVKQMAARVQNNQNMLFRIVNGNQAHIIFNRPKVMNAFSFDMYFLFTQFVERANQMPEIKYIVFRGAGGNFSSGNDLNNFMNEELASLDRVTSSTTMAQILVELTEVIVRSRKPIFALVEGRVIGFAFTQLALYDRVFATEDCYFMAPLVKIAQGPEMASSYLFPKIFGQALAEQIIIKGAPMTAKQLEKYNFVKCCSNTAEAEKALQMHIDELEKLDWPSYLEARRLMRLGDRDNVLRANLLESENLVARWSNPDLPAFLMKYLSESKLKPKL